jgi:hypothetical protein
MSDKSVKQAAEEYLAERLSKQGLTQEQTLNRGAALALAPKVWKQLRETVVSICNQWNEVTREQSLTYKETPLGDLRIRCTGRAHQLIFHFDAKKRLVRVENTAREEHEPKVALSIDGYATDSGRDARLTRNNQPVNVETLVLAQIRVLAGLSRKAEG